MTGFAFMRDRRWPVEEDSVGGDSGDPQTNHGGTAAGYKIGDRESTTRQVFWLGLKAYLWPRDAFPGADKSFLSRLGAFVGFNLTTPKEDWFLGIAFEPAPGLDLSVGRFLGKKTHRAPGYEVGDTLEVRHIPEEGVPSVPTIKKRSWGWFLGVTVDANFFRAVFGQALGNTGVNLG